MTRYSINKNNREMSWYHKVCIKTEGELCRGRGDLCRGFQPVIKDFVRPINVVHYQRNLQLIQQLEKREDYIGVWRAISLSFMKALKVVQGCSLEINKAKAEKIRNILINTKLSFSILPYLHCERMINRHKNQNKILLSFSFQYIISID